MTDREQRILDLARIMRAELDVLRIVVGVLVKRLGGDVRIDATDLAEAPMFDYTESPIDKSVILKTIRDTEPTADIS